jgi:hypothetical protein
VRPAADGAVAAEVRLEPGENVIDLHAWNEDGESPAQAARLSYRPPEVEPPPVVEVDPLEETTARPVALLRFRIRSRSAPRRVVLSREQSPAPLEVVQAFGPETLATGPDGVFEPTSRDAGVTIALRPGLNTFLLEAENAGGAARAVTLRCNYNVPAVRMELTGARTSSGDPLSFTRPHAEAPRTIRETLVDGAVVLSGRVIWRDKRSFDGANPRIQLWVNGFPQVEVGLGPAAAGDPLARPFRADLMLGRLHNKVDVRLYGAPIDIEGNRELEVACQKEDRKQRLHLWIIGVDVKDPEALRRRAIEALNGRYNEATRSYETPAFHRVEVYGPERNEGLTRRRMMGRLMDIKEMIRLNSRPANEVLMIFYQGGEVIEKDRGPCLRLRAGGGLGRDDIFPLSTIRSFLVDNPDAQNQGAETRGAKLFLLDVTHTPEQVRLNLSEATRWFPDDSLFGLFRFAWVERSDPTAFPFPPDASLAAALRTALQRRVTLEEVKADVEGQVAAMGRLHPDLRNQMKFTEVLNAAINGLVVGGR